MGATALVKLSQETLAIVLSQGQVPAAERARVSVLLQHLSHCPVPAVSV